MYFIVFLNFFDDKILLIFSFTEFQKYLSLISFIVIVIYHQLKIFNILKNLKSWQWFLKYLQNQAFLLKKLVYFTNINKWVAIPFKICLTEVFHKSVKFMLTLL